MAVGTRMPGWVDAGFAHYRQRLPRECALELIEVALPKRGKALGLVRLRRIEGEALLKAVPHGSRLVALAVEGQSWSTASLASTLNGWLQDGRDVALLVGGPDGLDEAVVRRAEVCWSLSPLTLPHALVRIVVAEQLYRAWSVLHNHPYHRA